MQLHLPDGVISIAADISNAQIIHHHQDEVGSGIMICICDTQAGLEENQKTSKKPAKAHQRLVSLITDQYVLLWHLHHAPNLKLLFSISISRWSSSKLQLRWLTCSDWSVSRKYPEELWLVKCRCAECVKTQSYALLLKFEHHLI